VADMVRVNTRISTAINEWLDEQSEQTGVPKSTIVHIALETYMQQKKSIDAMQMTAISMNALMAKMDSIEKKLSSANVMES